MHGALRFVGECKSEPLDPPALYLVPKESPLLNPRASRAVNAVCHFDVTTIAPEEWPYLADLLAEDGRAEKSELFKWPPRGWCPAGWSKARTTVLPPGPAPVDAADRRRERKHREIARA